MIRAQEEAISDQRFSPEFKDEAVRQIIYGGTLRIYHHSNRGSQYGVEEYRALLKGHGLRGSMGRRANPDDNAQAESFFKSMKYEEVYPKAYETFRDVVDQLPRVSNEVQNAERMYSALGYLVRSP